MLSFRRANIDDLETLVEARLIFLRTLRTVDETTEEYLNRKDAIRDYHRKALADGAVIAWLTYDEERLVAFGEACLYDVIPGFTNPTGKKAYLMNIYTDPDYRGRGIGMYTLHRLVTDCREKGVNQITLDATKLGKPLYLEYGFVPLSPDNMILDRDTPLPDVPCPA